MSRTVLPAKVLSGFTNWGVATTSWPQCAQGKSQVHSVCYIIDSGVVSYLWLHKLVSIHVLERDGPLIVHGLFDKVWTAMKFLKQHILNKSQVGGPGLMPWLHWLHWLSNASWVNLLVKSITNHNTLHDNPQNLWGNHLAVCLLQLRSAFVYDSFTDVLKVVMSVYIAVAR